MFSLYLTSNPASRHLFTSQILRLIRKKRRKVMFREGISYINIIPSFLRLLTQTSKISSDLILTAKILHIYVAHKPKLFSFLLILFSYIVWTSEVCIKYYSSPVNVKFLVVYLYFSFYVFFSRFVIFLTFCFIARESQNYKDKRFSLLTSVVTSQLK